MTGLRYCLDVFRICILFSVVSDLSKVRLPRQQRSAIEEVCRNCFELQRLPIKPACCFDRVPNLFNWKHVKAGKEKMRRITVFCAVVVRWPTYEITGKLKVNCRKAVAPLACFTSTRCWREIFWLYLKIKMLTRCEISGQMRSFSMLCKTDTLHSLAWPDKQCVFHNFNRVPCRTMHIKPRSTWVDLWRAFRGKWLLTLVS